MRLVSDAMTSGFNADEVKTLSQWIGVRHERNTGS